MKTLNSHYSMTSALNIIEADMKFIQDAINKSLNEEQAQQRGITRPMDTRHSLRELRRVLVAIYCEYAEIARAIHTDTLFS